MSPAPNVSRHEFSSLETSLREHLRECITRNKETGESLDELSHGLREIESLILAIKRVFWRAFLGLIGTVLTVGLTVLIQNWSAQQNAAAHSDKIVRSSVNAEQDRQTLIQQNTDILTEIRKDRQGRH